MSIKFNTTEVSAIQFKSKNGVTTNLDSVTYNEVQVFVSKATNYDKVKNATSTSTAVTESEWLAFINTGGPSQVVKNGDVNAFLNKYVKLPNSKTSSYQYWQIADFNHDGTSGTVDLIQVNNAAGQAFGSSNKYGTSSIRTWLNGTYLSGFSTAVQTALKTMSVVTNGSSTTDDKVKLLSGTEAGKSNANMPTGEGTKYPVTIGWKSGVNSYYYWLRSRNTYDLNFGWLVTASNTTTQGRYYDIFGVVPVIRF